MSNPAKLKNRRTFTSEFKVKVVLELIRGDHTISSASELYRIKDSVLARWKQEFVARAPSLFADHSNAQASEVDELKGVIAELSVELTVLKKACGISRSRNVGSSS